MKRIVLIAVIQLSCMCIATAQTRTIDSLLALVYQAKNEPQQLAAILRLCDEYQSMNRDTLDHYSFKALELSRRAGDKRMAFLAAIAVADDYYRWGWVDSALASI